MQVQNLTGPGVQRSKCPLLDSRTRYKYSVETFWNLVIWQKSVIRSSAVTKARVSEMSDQWRVSLYMVMPKNVMKRLTDFILFDVRSPYRPKNFIREDFKRSRTYPCPRSLYESHTALRIKHSRKEQASPGISYEL